MSYNTLIQDENKRTILYRGLSNIQQAILILENKTAGGFSQHICYFFCNLLDFCRKEHYECRSGRTMIPDFNTLYSKNSKIIGSFIQKQVSSGESFEKVVDKSTLDRYLVEYTTKEFIAKRFGHLGYIKIEILEKYTSLSVSGIQNQGKEGSVFCMSCAPCNIIGVINNIDASDIKLQKSQKIENAANYIEKIEKYQETLSTGKMASNISSIPII